MMKRNITKIGRALLLAALLPVLHACNLLGSIDDIEPEYVITDDGLISDASSAQQALNGVYAAWRKDGITSFRCMMALLARTQGMSMLGGGDEFMVEAVQTDNMAVEKAYTEYYYVVNEANSFIVNLNAKTDVPNLDETRRQEMLAEARCMRALANLSLLRCFGEFFDTDSKYGIVLYEDELVRADNPKARSTVAATYDLIERDLDFAISYAPQQTDHWRVSRLFAKALKCRVLMAKGDYDGAAALAGEAIGEAGTSGYGIEAEYSGVFFNQFNSSEMLFAPYTAYPYELIGTIWMMTTPGGLYTCLADNMVADPLPEPGEGGEEGGLEPPFELPDGGFPDGGGIEIPDGGDFPIFPGGDWGEPSVSKAYDSRYTFAFVEMGLPEVTSAAGFNKYPFWGEDFADINSYYYMRLAELYYIKAEAEARSGGYPAARAALSEVIARAGYDAGYADALPDEELVGHVLKHKLIELGIENMEEWFDLVRYHREGGFAGWTDDELAELPLFNKLLLPIPRSSLGGNALLEQNPEYLNQ